MITEMVLGIVLTIINSTALVVVSLVIFDLGAEILMDLIRKWPK